MKQFFAALPVLLLAAPALAQGTPPLGAFIQSVTTGTATVAPAMELPAQAVDTIKVGELSVVLEKTLMVDVTAALGGNVMHTGEAASSLDWTCYEFGETTLWFLSDGELGSGAVTTVALEAGTPQAEWQCAKAPDGLTVDFGIPGYGSDLVQVATTLGAIPDISIGALAYRSDTPVPDRQGVSTYQEIVYRFDDGRSDGFAVVQQTGD